jgi:hypothetical protein
MDRLNGIRFDPTETTLRRLGVDLQPGGFRGVLEGWVE